MKKVVLATVLSLSAVSANAATPTQVGTALMCAGSYQHFANLSEANGLTEQVSTFMGARSTLALWSISQMTSMGLQAGQTASMVNSSLEKGENLARAQIAESTNTAKTMETIHQICTPILMRAYRES